MVLIRWEQADDLPPTKGSSSAFSAKIEATIDLVDREVFQLGGESCQIYTSHLTSERLRDGQPGRRGATSLGAVRLATDCRRGRLAWTCSTYGAWEDNLRGIALTLEKLRAIDRYGATHGEQYAGFAALPAGDGGAAARATLLNAAGMTLEDYEREEATSDAQLVKMAIRRTHPDRHHGDRTAYDAVIDAARDLGVRP